MAPLELYDEVFPIKFYHNDYYVYKYKTKLSTSEKFYISIYESCKDIRKTEILMEDAISKTQVLKIRKKLSELGIIKISIMNVETAKQFCIENSHKGLKCDWCGKKSYILHKHHYPIPKNKGGQDVVNICPNCHCTYHSLIVEE